MEHPLTAFKIGDIDVNPPNAGGDRNLPVGSSSGSGPATGSGDSSESETIGTPPPPALKKPEPTKYPLIARCGQWKKKGSPRGLLTCGSPRSGAGEPSGSITID